MKYRSIAFALLLAGPATALGASSAFAAPTVATPATTIAAAAPAAPAALEPRALAILKTSLDTIKAAQTLSFSATELFESSSRQGQPLASATRYDVSLARPDRLRVAIPGDGMARQFTYDGKTVLAYAPVENIYATGAVPPTIDAMLSAVYKKGAVYLPFTDLIVADPYKDLRTDVKLAYVVGQSSVIGGVTTDIVAYVINGVFIETWIGADDKLPRLIRAVYLDDPAKLRHELAFSNWQLNPTFAPDTFATTVPSGAKLVPIAPHPFRPATAKP